MKSKDQEINNKLKNIISFPDEPIKDYNKLKELIDESKKDQQNSFLNIEKNNYTLVKNNKDVLIEEAK